METKAGEDIIIIVPADALRRRYKVRRVRSGTRCFEATFPWEVVEREARRTGYGDDVDAFLRDFEAEFLYDHFGGAHFRFVPKESRPTPEHAKIG